VRIGSTGNLMPLLEIMRYAGESVQGIGN
jgi:hypothetical protein